MVKVSRNPIGLLCRLVLVWTGLAHAMVASVTAAAPAGATIPQGTSWISLVRPERHEVGMEFTVSSQTWEAPIGPSAEMALTRTDYGLTTRFRTRLSQQLTGWIAVPWVYAGSRRTLWESHHFHTEQTGDQRLGEISTGIDWERQLGALVLQVGTYVGADLTPKSRQRSHGASLSVAKLIDPVALYVRTAVSEHRADQAVHGRSEIGFGGEIALNELIAFSLGLDRVHHHVRQAPQPTPRTLALKRQGARWWTHTGLTYAWRSNLLSHITVRQPVWTGAMSDPQDPALIAPSLSLSLTHRF